MDEGVTKLTGKLASANWGKMKAAALVSKESSNLDIAKMVKAAALKENADSAVNAMKEAQEAHTKFLKEHAVDQLSDFQIEEFRDAFRVFDVDGSGNIDKEELKKLMLSVGQNPDDDELDEMVRIADADGSGEVDFYEFVALMAHKMADPINLEAVASAFSMFDHNRDNTIDTEELHAIMMNVGEPVTYQDIQTVLQEMDSNGDGSVDVEEFTRMLLHDHHNMINEALSPEKNKQQRRSFLPRFRKAASSSHSEGQSA